MNFKTLASLLFVVFAVCCAHMSAQTSNHIEKQNAVLETDSNSLIILQNARRNEKNFIAALRTIHRAQATYQATTGNGNFASLSQLAQAGLIDDALATGSIYGYSFSVTTRNFLPPNQPATFEVVAVPQRYRKTGVRSFFMETSGIIRGADKQGAAANRNDPPIEEEFVCNSIAECEAAAINSLRTLHSAQTTYQATAGNGNFGSLCQLGAENLLNQFLTAGSRYGYYFVVAVAPQTQNSSANFEIRAIPHRYGITGLRAFFIELSGVIRAADRQGAPANGDDPPIPN